MAMQNKEYEPICFVELVVDQLSSFYLSRAEEVVMVGRLVVRNVERERESFGLLAQVVKKAGSLGILRLQVDNVNKL